MVLTTVRLRGQIMTCLGGTSPKTARIEIKKVTMESLPIIRHRLPQRSTSHAVAAGVGQVVGVIVTRPQPVVHWTQAVVVGQTVVVTGSTVMLVQPHAKGRAAVVCQAFFPAGYAMPSEMGPWGSYVPSTMHCSTVLQVVGQPVVAVIV